MIRIINKDGRMVPVVYCAVCHELIKDGNGIALHVDTTGHEVVDYLPIFPIFVHKGICDKTMSDGVHLTEYAPCKVTGWTDIGVFMYWLILNCGDKLDDVKDRAEFLQTL
jgi:hypothetical protein